MRKEVLMEFKISLKAARVNAGLTILEACEKLGISKDTMIRWEREPWLISAINMDKISKVYNISIDNINGPIYLTNIEGEEAEIYNINGNIRIDGLASKNLDASSNAGTIRVFNIENTEDIKLKSGFGNIVVDTTDFSGDIRANVESKAI